MTQKMFIPTVGTEIKLEENWTFYLYQESRNNTLLKVMGFPSGGWGTTSKYQKATLNKGTTLIVDRIYIRNNASEFDSITLRIGEVPDSHPKKFKKKRFWASLGDINNIVFSVVSGEPRSDGILFILCEKDYQHYKKPPKSKTFKSLNSVKEFLLKQNKGYETPYVFQVPQGSELPNNYKTWSRKKANITYDKSEIDSKYKLLYKPEGFLGKGPNVTFRRVNFLVNYKGKDPEGIFFEDDDKEAIRDASSVYLMVDDLRSQTQYKRSYATPAVIFKKDGNWQARLTGMVRAKSSSILYKEVKDIWNDEGYIPLRTLTEGVTLLEDFFEENLYEYGRALREAENHYSNSGV